MEEISVGALNPLPVPKVIETLSTHLTPERVQRVSEVVSRRSRHLVPVMENIYDLGNVSAVMRSSEALGFWQMTWISAPGAKYKAANRVARGADKWMDVRRFTSPALAVEDLHARGYQVWATDLNTSHTIDSVDWTRPTAVVLGNEKDGVSPELRGLVDGCFRIPMLGFAQSFNISVAAALIFYHAYSEHKRRQVATELSSEEKRYLLADYMVRCFEDPEGLLRTALPAYTKTTLKFD